MVKIRLSRTGAKKRPFYHIVAIDERKARGGKSLERLGLFNPVAAGAEEKLRINTERLNYWIENGAQISERVAKLVRDHEKVAAAA